VEASGEHSGDARGGRRHLRVSVGLAFVPLLRPALYGLLAGSAVLAFWAGSELAGKRMPPWMAAMAPAFFGVFVAIFAVYRLTLVRARRYPAATGLFQIGLGALVFVLLLPGTRRQLSEQPAGFAQDDVAALLGAGDPRVRALAAEVAGSRPGGQRWAAQLIDRLTDSDARVRAACRLALARIAGSDPAAGLSDEAAAARWRDEARTRGW
jgi:hypothetical protein